MGQEASHTQVFWGTNVSANEVQTKLKAFINTYVELSGDDDDDDSKYMRTPYYLEKLKQLKEMEETVLQINCDHLYQFD
jgi:hypothetical protein